MLRRCVGVVKVVAVFLAGGEHVIGVVRVVVPLRSVLARSDEARLVGVVLEHQVDLGRDRLADLVEDMARRVVEDGVHRVEPEAVEMVLVDPVARVVHEVLAHPAALEVDRRAPGRLVPVGEKLRRVLVQEIAFRSEIVVHHVEQHYQSGGVRRLHQRLQVLGAAVAAVGRIRQHTVVAPVPLAAEVRERHQLDRGDPRFLQVIEFFADTIVGALLGKASYMQLIEHRFVPRPAFPFAVLPLERRRIDHFARAFGVLRLEARRGIGNEVLAVYAVAIERSWFCGMEELEPARIDLWHRYEVLADGQSHVLCGGRPEAKAHALRGHFGPERHRVASDQRFLRGHQRSSSSAAQSLPPSPKASASANTTPASRIRKLWRTMSPPTLTWSSAISTTKVRIAYCARRPRISASCRWMLRQYAVTALPMKRAKYAPKARISSATITLGTNSTTRPRRSVM